MHFTAAEIAAWVGSFLWPFFRIGAMLMVAPVTSGNFVPTRVRLILALAVTLAVAPNLSEIPAVDPFSLDALLIILQQILIGVAMGFSLQLVFAAVVGTGQILAMQMGLGMAQSMDPQNGVNVPIIAQLLMMLTTLLFLIMNGHLILIQMLVESFRILPIAPDGLVRGGFWAIVMWGKEMYAAALWLALPAVISLLVIKIAFGVMTKAAPQLNIFSIGFPVFVISGFIILMITLPNLAPQFGIVLEQGYELINRVLSGGGA